jgi:hypothetical protein
LSRKAAFIFVKARWPGRLEYREPLFLKYENEDEEMEFLDTRQVAQVNICKNQGCGSGSRRAKMTHKSRNFF